MASPLLSLGTAVRLVQASARRKTKKHCGLAAQSRLLSTRCSQRIMTLGKRRAERGSHRPRKRRRHQDVERCEPTVERVSPVLVAARPKETQERDPPPTRLRLLQVLRKRNVYWAEDTEGERGTGGGVRGVRLRRTRLPSSRRHCSTSYEERTIVVYLHKHAWRSQLRLMCTSKNGWRGTSCSIPAFP